MLLNQARAIAEELVRHLRPACERIEIGGSIRRGKDEVKDIEIVCVPRSRMDEYQQAGLFQVSDSPHVTTALDLRLAELVNEGIMVRERLNGQRMKTFFVPKQHGGIKLDLFIVLPPAQWGCIFTMRTGPAEFSKWVVTQKRLGGGCPDHLRISEGGVYGQFMIPTPEETDFFRAMELAWIEPGRRRARWWGRG